MSDLTFTEPQWIHLVWCVLALVTLLVWLDQRGSSGLDRFVSPLMQQTLATRPQRWRRLLRIFLLGLSGLCLVAALMRPQSGNHRVSMPRLGAQVMVCLDVSKSMLAEDVAPNRLKRAKAEILDLLTYLKPDHVGLIAFAGKATVMCPLTPDFGFLRLVLDSVGPYSVARGGTNLEAPIRKAMDGFRGQADLSRAIILITDGDDHDSFAAEAAKQAAERGIRIIAIGLGNKAGSQINVTDSNTGARTRLLNADGEPVLTRLEGDMLSKIALATEGVYIPAGTGALDLKAIYDAHIAPMTRGRLEDSGRLVKHERFQWAVLLALLSLVAAVTVAGARPTLRVGLSAGYGKAIATAVAIVLAWGLVVSTARAQITSQIPNQQVSEPHRLDKMEEDAAQTDPIEDVDMNVDPREVYNEAVTMFRNDDLDQAEAKFSLARRRAGADGTTRYRSTYNLGWVAVKRADKLIKDQPQAALAHLHEAANWFREAVSLQKDEPESRQNLEIIARRAIALADALNKQEKQNLAAQLDDLIMQQRGLIAECQGAVQRVASLEQPMLPDHLRGKLGNLEVTQRQIMSTLSEIADSVRNEVLGLEEIEKDKRNAEQSLRIAQLGAVEAYLYQASQRAGQTRRHLRGRQAPRAYRRASLTLGEMKRARDQLRSLVELLGSLVQDAGLLTKQTSNLISAIGLVPGTGQAPPKPQWLSRDYLVETLTTIRGRNDELATRIELGLANDDATSNDGDPDVSAMHDPPASIAKGESAQDIQRQDLLTLLRGVRPIIQDVRNAFTEADTAFTSQHDQDAYQALARGTAQLIEARELFLDIRGLIEVMYSDQQRMQSILVPDQQAQTAPIAEYLPLLTHWAAANAIRAHRLDGQIDRELVKLTANGPDVSQAVVPLSGAGPDTGSDSKQDPEDTARVWQRQQLERAKPLLAAVINNFQHNHDHLEILNASDADVATIQRLRDRVDQGVEQIEVLRRLFFSIVERLRDTADRQVQLADQTREKSTLLEDEQMKAAIGPLVPRQVQLRTISQRIAESLQKQSEQAPPLGPSGEAEGDAARASQQEAHRFQQAAHRVTEATGEMDDAVDVMRDDLIDLTEAHASQQMAAVKLREALKLLLPPPPPQQDPQSRENQDQPQQQGDDVNKDKQQPSRQMDMEGLLQAVRDRDAKRQRDKRRGQTSTYAPVVKDW